jgi:pyrroline-5-carboxylate reductase
MRIGFAGAGNMAGAIARGWAAGDGGPEAMLFCDLDSERAEALAEQVGGDTRAKLTEIARDSDAVLLAVKPAALEAAAADLGDARAAISVLAATPVERLQRALPGVPLVRVMPNQPVEVRRGVLCYVQPPDMPAEVAEPLLDLLGELGELVPMAEDRMEAAMAVMSCSPAYVAGFAERLTAAGEREGLDPKIAAELVIETIAGTAEQLRLRKPSVLMEAVASPGGATEAGVQALERGGFGQAIDAAVDASLERFR